MTELLKHFDVNIKGRDFVVGDLHGCRDLFDEKLVEIAFDPTVDRMFSVGDLVDRGPDSPGCAALLDECWFHAVRGNHEQGWIDFERGPKYEQDIRYMRSNGADWEFPLGQDARERFFNNLNTLPYAIEVETPFGKVGIVHAELPYGWSWLDLRAFLGDPNGVEPDAVTVHHHGWEYNEYLYALIESREQGKKVLAYSRDFSKSLPTDFSGVPGVERVYSGHTPIEGGTPLLLGNHYWLDTHAYETGNLSIVEIAEDEELWAFRESVL